MQFLQRLQIVKRDIEGWVWRITATFRQSSLNMFTHDMFTAPIDVSNQSKWFKSDVRLQSCSIVSVRYEDLYIIWKPTVLGGLNFMCFRNSTT